jgi:hypothetical protein
MDNQENPELPGENQTPGDSQLPAYIYFFVISSTESIMLMIFAVRCWLLVRKHQPFLICYIIIGIVFVSNFFFLLKQLIINFAPE